VFESVFKLSLDTVSSFSNELLSIDSVSYWSILLPFDFSK
jgi:hypothetical protein